ncbi:MAG: hypothetical protein ACAF41_06700 [Leptolyngbya sp. BL-A-14]
MVTTDYVTGSTIRAIADSKRTIQKNDIQRFAAKLKYTLRLENDRYGDFHI